MNAAYKILAAIGICCLGTVVLFAWISRKGAQTDSGLSSGAVPAHFHGQIDTPFELGRRSSSPDHLLEDEPTRADTGLESPVSLVPDTSTSGGRAEKKLGALMRMHERFLRSGDGDSKTEWHSAHVLHLHSVYALKDAVGDFRDGHGEPMRHSDSIPDVYVSYNDSREYTFRRSEHPVLVEMLDMLHWEGDGSPASRIEAAQRRALTDAQRATIAECYERAADQLAKSK